MRSSPRRTIQRIGPVLAAALILTAGAGPTAANEGAPDVGPAGTALMHGDLASSDSTPHAGPGPGGHVVASSVPGGVCAATFIGADGMPLSLCNSYVGLTPPDILVPTVKLFDPVSAAPVASIQLPKGGLLGGVYGYLDASDRVVVADGAGVINKVAHRRTTDGRWELFIDERVDVSAHIPAGDAITGVAPDHRGGIWFVTTHGVVGTAGADGHIATAQLPEGEDLTNGLSVRPDGVSVLTTEALYEMRIGADGSPAVLWRAPYAAGSVRKPGQLGPGSGTTPTYFGPGGDAWVAIVDDAARPELTVYRSDDGSEVCRMPAFETSGQGTENSPMAWRNSLVIPSTYGFSYPPQATSGPSDPPQAAFVGGMTRVDVGEDGCRRVWESADRMATLPRLSRGDGLIHGLSYGPLSPGVDIQQVGPVYYTAVDFDTGERRAYQQVGVAPVDEPLQLTGTIGPDGTLWQGTVGRMLKIGR
ncbi:hypothetical protein [Nocardia carnea]|uniref:Secreted protein n=1 Tax=Nocardia carnea TaxID=37328 RepID=A0ABW7TT50_9NOCA|nr:hypothetical protein [Nocardia carnea]